MELEQRKFPKVRSKEEAYRKLSFVIYHYQNFTKKQKELLEWVICDNTIGKLALSNKIYYDRIFNFKQYGEYFLYNVGGGELEFIHKSDVNYLHYQVTLIIQKGFESYKYLSN